MKPKSFALLLAGNSNRQSATLLALAISGMLIGPQAHAANRIWNGSSDTNWATAANWSVAPVSGQDTLVFGGSAGLSNTNNLAADFVVTGLNFTNTNAGGASTVTGNFTISGERITLGGNINTTAVGAAPNPATITDVVGLPIILSANRTVTTGTNHNLNLTGILSESASGFGLVKAGPATLSLQGANTFTGAVQINEGTLNISIGGSINTASSVTVGAGSTFTLANGATNLSDRLKDTGTVTLNGGTFNFNNNAAAATSYSETLGTVSISALANTFSSGQAVTGQSSTLTLSSLGRVSGTGATVNFQGTGLGSLLDTRNQILITANPTLTNNLIGGWATVSGTSWATYDATFGVTALPLTSYTENTWSPESNTTVTTSTAPGSSSTTNSLRYNAVANVGAAYTVTLDGVNTISSGGILVAAAVGANASTITGGTLQGSAGGSLIIHQNNSTATPTTAGVANGANAVVGVNQGFLSIGSIIQDNATATGLIKTGAGQLTLTAANTYTGTTYVSNGAILLSGSTETIKGNITIGNSGRISLGADNQISDSAIITFASGINSGRVLINGKNETIGGINDAAGTFSGSRIVEASTDNNFNLPVGTLTINATSNSTFGGLVRDTAGTRGLTDAPSILAITKNGSGTQEFTAAVSYSGATTVNAGTLRFAGTNTANNNSTITLAGGTMDFNVTAGGTPNRSRLITGSSTTGNLSKTGAGPLILSGANTYLNPTRIDAGTLQAGVASIADVSGAFGLNSAVTTANVASAILALNSFNTQIGSLAGGGANGGNVTLGSATLTLGGNNTNTTYAGVISGTGGVTKIGTGIQTLNGINTYAGATTVTTGTLRLGTASLADASTLTIGTSADSPAVLNLPNAGTDTVATLIIDGVTQPSGLYDSANSAGAITGLGKIQVGTSGDPYATWAASFGLQNPWLGSNPALNGEPTGDPDQDGVANLLEFVLGGSPIVSSQAQLPTATIVGSNLVLSYKRSDESEAPATTQIGQWSSDLQTWNAITPVLVSENGELADDMTVSTPTSNAVGGKLFIRLNVATPAN
jgi:fibronectin-binding autotransporter adhesin